MDDQESDAKSNSRAESREPSDREPGLTLWQYAEQVRATWTAAEEELARAVRWLLIFVTVQLLTWDLSSFGPTSPDKPFELFKLQMSVPGYLIGVGLAVAASYWLSLYVYASISISTTIMVHKAVIHRLISVVGNHPQDTELLRMPLTPPRSVAGRPPQDGIAVRFNKKLEKIGVPVVVVLVTGLELVRFIALQPFGGSDLWYVWVVGLLVTLGWLLSTYVYFESRVREEQVECMLNRLEHTVLVH